MSTRSTVKFISKQDDELTPLVNIYQHYDGYIEGVGYDLARFLLSKEIVNGISLIMDRDKIANGFGCLIAQYIRDFKTEVGGFYITNMDDEQDYNYEVIFDEDKFWKGDNYSIDDLITIKVDSYPKFEGTPSELLEFKEKCDDE